MRALVCGVLGQDGAYLARLLLNKGYDVWGTSRRVSHSSLDNLNYLNIQHQVHLLTMNANDDANVREVVAKSQPDELYWLSGQSSVGRSFQQPHDTVHGGVLGLLNVLEAVRLLNPLARVFNASSGEIFGDLGDRLAEELSPLQAASPYAAAKVATHALIQSYRLGFGLFASNAIFFNHESPLRPHSFVTRKIVAAAARARDTGEMLSLGRLDIARDWGWAPDYVESMWLTLQHDRPDDFVIATGQAHALTDFVAQAYAFFDLDWHDHVRSDPSLFRPSDRTFSAGSPDKAARDLGWRSRHQMPDVVRMMCEAEQILLTTTSPQRGA